MHIPQQQPEVFVAAQQSSQFVSVEAWRELERTSSDSKHEYIDGSVYAMAGGTLDHSQIAINKPDGPRIHRAGHVGGTLDHSQIAINTLITLATALGNGPCRVYNSDAAARLSPTRYTYPDATVTCDERDRGRITEIQAPRVIIEVLSPDSTEGFDRGRKFAYYRACPTVQEYVLVNTAYQAVEVYRRDPDGWAGYHVYEAGEWVELASIGVRFALASLYARTEVPEHLDRPDGEL